MRSSLHLSIFDYSPFVLEHFWKDVTFQKVKDDSLALANVINKIIQVFYCRFKQSYLNPFSNVLIIMLLPHLYYKSKHFCPLVILGIMKSLELLFSKIKNEWRNRDRQIKKRIFINPRIMFQPFWLVLINLPEV